MSARLVSGGRAFIPRRGSSYCTVPQRECVPHGKELQGSQLERKEDGQAGGKEVPGDRGQGA